MKKQLKRLLCCLTLCAVLAGGLTVPAAAGFADVPANHWAGESIRRCVELGFFQGQSASRFGLGQKMTRSAFTVVLCRFFGWETTAPAKAIYQDVPADAWYAGAVEAAYSHGALTDQREHFRPNDPITREELAVMLVRAMGYGTIAGLAQDLPMPFRDVTTNTGYITMAYDLGLVSGTTADTFSPNRAATREQVAVILMRLYDKLHQTGPGQIAVASAPGDFTGLEAVAVPAGRLIVVNGKPMVNTTMDQKEAASILEAAKQAGAKKLLYLTGGPSALNGTAIGTAGTVAAEVSAGGYDGVLLEVPALSTKKSGAMTNLVKALDKALGDKLLYVLAEAPSRTGKTYGYEYEVLAAAADRLVLRLAPYETFSDGFPTAPVDPLEEIYYALGTLCDSIDSGKLALMVTTGVSAWSGQKKYSLTQEEYEALLADPKTGFHYSNRYACAYLTGTVGSSKKEVVVWYLDRQAAAARLQMAQAFGVGQLCLDNWAAASPDLLSGLR